jgi:magnesium transporter
MLTFYGTSSGMLVPLGGTGHAVAPDNAEGVVWIDLFQPSSEEDGLVKQIFGVDIPTREEMEEIELSSRIYQENGAAFMTALLPANTDTGTPEALPVTFILAGERLVTVRYHQPRAFEAYVQRATRSDVACSSADGIALGLLDAVIDRVADILENAGRQIDVISRKVFGHDGAPVKSRDFQSILSEIGRKADIVSDVRDSLSTLQRVATYLGQLTAKRAADRDVRAGVKTLSRDAASLADQASYLSQKLTFLLDASLGMINIEQSGIIKIFSVAAVIFLPPTLVASIYGMNFEHMPELSWTYGYPYALGLMVLAAVLPYLFFKRKGWL